MKTKRSDRFADGHDIKMVQDPWTQDVWVLSFNHLDFYDSKKKEWKNQDTQLQKMDFGQCSWKDTVVPDEKYVWILASGNAYSQGAVLRYTKANGQWTAFRKELNGGVDVPQFSADFILSDNETVWVMFAPGNGYNIHVATYKDGVWKSTDRHDFAPFMKEWARKMDQLRWASSVSIFTRLDSSISSVGRISADHPYSFSAKEVDAMTTAWSEMKKSAQASGLYMAQSRGWSVYTRRGQKITEDKSGKTILELPLRPTNFFRIVSTPSKEEVIVQDQERGAIVNTKKKSIRVLSGELPTRGDKSAVVIVPQKNWVIGAETYYGMDDSEVVLFLIDTVADNIQKMTLPVQAEAIELGICEKSVAMELDGQHTFLFRPKTKKWARRATKCKLLKQQPSTEAQISPSGLKIKNVLAEVK